MGMKSRLPSVTNRNVRPVRTDVLRSKKRSQFDSVFIIRGTLQLMRLHRAAINAIIPWNGSSNPEPKIPATPKVLSTTAPFVNLAGRWCEDGEIRTIGRGELHSPVSPHSPRSRRIVAHSENGAVVLATP